MLIWFGTGRLAQSVIVGFFCFVVMGITAQNAAQAIPPAFEEMAATLGATPRQRLWHIVVPAAVPSLIAAVRVCLVTGWSLQVASELLGGARGVGKVVSLSEQLGNTAGALAIIILLAAAGLLIETVAATILRHATRWQVTAS
jgi:ABC-type nitrate/sulfonate/bicarbonate transport system permease component